MQMWRLNVTNDNAHSSKDVLNPPKLDNGELSVSVSVEDSMYEPDLYSVHVGETEDGNTMETA